MKNRLSLTHDRLGLSAEMYEDPVPLLVDYHTLRNFVKELRKEESKDCVDEVAATINRRPNREKRKVKTSSDVRKNTEIGKVHVLGVLRTPGPPEPVPATNGLENAQLCLAEQLRSVLRQLRQISAQLSKIKFPLRRLIERSWAS